MCHENRLQCKKNAKNGSNRHPKKHNHDKRSTCCPPKMPCPGSLLRNPDLDIGKKYTKIKKQTVFLLMASTFYESNLQ